MNPVKIHIEKTTKNDKKLVNDLDYDKVGVFLRENFFRRIETKNNICINVICYENKLTFPINISDKEIENSMDLLLVIDENYVTLRVHQRF